MEILEVEYPLVYIRWLDHMTDDEWRSPDNVLKDPPTLLTVGWVVYEDERVVTLAQCVDPKHKDFSMQFLILKSCIVERCAIKEIPHG